VILALAVGLAGAIGASARHALGARFTPRLGPSWPWVTMGINVVASFLLAIVVRSLTIRHGIDDPGIVLGVGFCGGLSTWSTVTWEVDELRRSFDPARSAAYLLAAPLTSIGAAAMGWWLAGVL